MDLSNRGGRKRMRFELRVELFEWFAQLPFDIGPYSFGRIRRRIGLKLGEFRGKPGANQVGPCAKHLAQLNEGRAKLGQSKSNAFLTAEVLDRWLFRSVGGLLDQRDRNRPQPSRQAVFDQDLDDFT